MDKRRQVRAAKQKTVEVKRRRLFNKRNRAQRSSTQEQREGISYETECGLDGIADLVDDPQGMVYYYTGINSVKVSENLRS